MLNPVASSVLVISYLVLAILMCGLLGAICFALLKLNARLDDFSHRLDPLLQKADDALTITTETVEMLGSRAESVLSQSEAAVETVHEKVDRTAIAVQQVVNTPIIKANSIVAGVSRGFSTFARLQKHTSAGLSVRTVKNGEED